MTTYSMGDAAVRLFMAASDSDYAFYVGGYAEVRTGGLLRMYHTTRDGLWSPTSYNAEQLGLLDSTMVHLSTRESFDEVDAKAVPSLESRLDQIAIARRIAEVAHEGQADKNGDPYIDHVRRIVAQLPDLTAQAVGWLHDVIEDTGWTRERLLGVGVDPSVVHGVLLCTRRPDVASDDYYAAIRADEVALAVKLADIADNTDPKRLERLDLVTRARLAKKYQEARHALGVDEADDPMASWTPGDEGWAICTMAGGAYDGTTFGDFPVLPDGQAPGRVSMPRDATPEESAVDGQIFAVYDRQTKAEDGTWLFVFVGDVVGDSSAQPNGPVGGASAGYTSDVAPDDEPVEESSDEWIEDEEPPFTEPAMRFVLAQSWWIAAELCRRHPSRRIYEMHPLDGHYDVLRVWGPQAKTPDKSHVLAQLNRVGTIHVGDDAVPGISWTEALAADSPHAVVKRIEQETGRTLHAKAPATTPTSLVYRVIAQLLATKVDDREPWDVRMEYEDSSAGSGPRHYVRLFPTALAAHARAGERMTAWDPGEHFWGVLRGGTCLGVLDDAGVLHTADGALELMPLYRRRHDLQDVMREVFDALPG